MTAWGSLRDVYGSAEQVPSLLAAAEASGAQNSGVWDELWGRLCHQGTVAEASYAALPVLAAMSERHEAAGYVPAVHLAACIIASTDGPEPSAAIRQRYEDAVSGLRAVAERNLRHAADDTDFVYGLQALMAFENGGVWQRNLHFLANGEAEFACPSCAEQLLLDLDARPFAVRSFVDASLEPTAVAPADTPPQACERRMLALAHDEGRPEVAKGLKVLFGTATCPNCGTTFPIATALA